MIADLLDLALIGAAVAVLVSRTREGIRARAEQRRWHEFLVGHDMYDN
jgi:hypothetical protein